MNTNILSAPTSSPEAADLAASPRHFETMDDFLTSNEQILDIYATQLGVDKVVNPDEFNALCAREWGFYSKVYNAAMKLRDAPEVVALFDVDDTIADGAYPNLITRPAFPLVVSALDQALGGKLRVGLLTSYIESNIKDEQGRPSLSCLAAVRPEIIEPDLLISTHPHPGYNNRFYTLTDEQILGNVEGFINPQIIKATREGHLSINSWYDREGKIDILMALSQGHPDTGFLYVDNLPSAGMIQNTDRVVGLCVGPEMQTYPAVARARYETILSRADTI
jgi:hypothetical protein